jgi:hypothetical protein
MDNIMIERLWRSLKYEDIYIKQYESVPELKTGLTAYLVSITMIAYTNHWDTPPVSATRTTKTLSLF